MQALQWTKTVHLVQSWKKKSFRFTALPAFGALYGYQNKEAAAEN